MDTVYEYARKRKEFGKHPKFTDSENFEICNIEPTDKFDSQWKIRPTTTLSIDCIPQVSEHSANTERFIQVDRTMSHKEGGWPKDINVEEFSDKQRFVRKIEMGETYNEIVLELSKRVENCVLQNNSINMYEEYFKNLKIDHSSKPPSVKTITIFRDPNINNIRNISCIAWHPENINKIGVSYCNLAFDKNINNQNDNIPLYSYIWDINNPNKPDFTLIPESHLCCLSFNKKSPEYIIGGCYNGLINFWDQRKGSKPIEKSIIQHSHNDPVYDIKWIQSRTGSEFCSISTDGYIYWWDTRKLGSGPTDQLLLKNNETSQIYGGTSLEYRTDAGATKYLIGTEQGGIITVERKAKKDGESQKQIKTYYGIDNIIGGGKHFGPIYSISRNYFIPKGILTTGDWSTKLWMEDVKTPIITFKYDNNFLTNGLWSPTRPGVFFTTKSNGILDIWDIYYKQDKPIFNLKISEKSLTCLDINNNGKLIATGSKDGNVNILELSKSLYKPALNEKNIISQLLDREMLREKNLQNRLLTINRLQKKKSSNNNNSDQKDDNEESNNNNNGKSETIENEIEMGNETDLKKLEEEFLKIVEKNKPQKLNDDFKIFGKQEDNEEKENTTTNNDKTNTQSKEYTPPNEENKS